MILITILLINFLYLSSKEFHSIAPSDYRFWEYLNEVVQGEPSESSYRVSLGYFASIGIEKGKTFSPDARMKKILTIPGKGWFTMLNLYGPEKSWFDKSWRPGEIELVQ